MGKERPPGAEEIMDTKFLEKRREISFDWHITQVLKWLEFDNGRQLDSVLVYASVELRCAIERFWFELLLVLKGQNLTPEEERRCQSKDGILELIRETEPYYIKRATFTNLVASVRSGMPKVVIVDIRYLVRMWHKLSEYCHKQLLEEESFGSSTREFQKRGFQIINEIVNRFKEWLSQAAFGIISKQKMAPETRTVYDKYINGEIDEGQAKRMLDLMAPILRARMR